MSKRGSTLWSMLALFLLFSNLVASRGNGKRPKSRQANDLSPEQESTDMEFDDDDDGDDDPPVKASAMWDFVKNASKPTKPEANTIDAIALNCYKEASEYCVKALLTKARKFFPKVTLTHILDGCNAGKTFKEMVGHMTKVGYCIHEKYKSGKVECAVATYEEAVEMTVIPDISLLKDARPSQQAKGAFKALNAMATDMLDGCAKKFIDECNGELPKCPLTNYYTQVNVLEPPVTPSQDKKAQLSYYRAYCRKFNTEYNSDDTEHKLEIGEALAEKAVLMNKRLANDLLSCVMMRVEAFCAVNQLMCFRMRRKNAKLSY